MEDQKTGVFYITTNLDSFLDSHALLGKNLQYTFSLCGVDEARSIRSQIASLPTHEYYVVTIVASNITEEAQNVLLKVTEELPKKIILVLSISQPTTLLGTLLSRAYELVYEKYSIDESFFVVSKQIFETTFALRLELLEKLFPKTREHDTHLMRERAKMFIDFLIEELTRQKEYLLLSRLLKIKILLDREITSLKALLEYAVLIIPYKQ